MDITSYLLGKQAGGSGGGSYDWPAIGYSGEPQAIKEGYDYAVEIMNNWQPATNLANKFYGDANLMFMPLVDTSNTEGMSQMFYSCTSLMKIPLLNTEEVRNMSSTFAYCSSLTEVALLDTSKVTNMRQMFSNCEKIKTIPPFDTSSVTNFQNTFTSCNNLENFPAFNAEKATNFSGMFGNRSSFSSFSDTSLDNVLKMCISATSYTGTKTLTTLGFSTYNCPASRIQTLPSYQAFLNAGWTLGY